MRETAKSDRLLDYDDTLYPDAHAVLVNELRDSGCAVAFAGIALKGVAASAAVPLGIGIARTGRMSGHGLLDAFRQGFCQFHGMLVDRTRIAPEDLRLDESLPIYEDYDWHLQLGARHPFSYAAIDQIVGDYRQRDDGSNTISLRHKNDAHKLAFWQFWAAEIESRRSRIEIAPAIQVRLGIDPPRPGLTIRRLLDLVDCRQIALRADTVLLPRVATYDSADVMP